MFSPWRLAPSQPVQSRMSARRRPSATLSVGALASAPSYVSVFDCGWHAARSSAAKAKRRIDGPPSGDLSTSEPNHLAADEHSADLVGAGADVEQLGVAVIALPRPVLRVACAAQRLHRLVRDLHRIFRRVED